MQSQTKKFIMAPPFHSVNLAALFSGGKDSTYAIYIAQQRGWNVEYLVTVIPEKDSMMFHHPNIGLTEHLSTAMGIPHVAVASAEGEEEELKALSKALGQLRDIDGVVTGAIASDYQWSRINGICEKMGLKTFSPLWRMDGMMILSDMVKAGFAIIFDGVSAEGLDSSWLGKKLESGTLEELANLMMKNRINVSGEGGEFETLVLDGPNLEKRLVIEDSSVDWRRDSGILMVEKAALEDK
jgi:ABC transporter with metal-binding/Fe-S-binding domain ATP-binding protein